MKTMKYLITLLATATLLSAAEITITTTAAQDRAITRVANQMNTERVNSLLAEHPSATLTTNKLDVIASIDGATVGTTRLITALQYGRMLLDSVLDGIVRQVRNEIRQEVSRKYDEADQVTKDQISTILQVEE
jgi:hypothetical protein